MTLQLLENMQRSDHYWIYAHQRMPREGFMVLRGAQVEDFRKKTSRLGQRQEMKNSMRVPLLFSSLAGRQAVSRTVPLLLFSPVEVCYPPVIDRKRAQDISREPEMKVLKSVVGNTSRTDQGRTY